jgi:hypothetical protein
MPTRPRIDLDGVALHDETNPHMVVAIFRYRATEGLVLLIPESTDVLVDWSHVREAQIDLAHGTVRVTLDPAWVATQNWLRGATTLVGRWMDRFTLSSKLAVERG